MPTTLTYKTENKAEIAKMLLQLGVSYNILTADSIVQMEVGQYVYLYAIPKLKFLATVEHELDEVVLYSDKIYGMWQGEMTNIFVFYKPSMEKDIS